jgi:hypothetical protein
VNKNPDNLWLSTNVDILVHSTDGGTTWTADTLVPQQAKQTGLYDIAFTDTSHGWVTGYGQVFNTTDGGKTWMTQADTTGGVLPSDIIRGLSLVNGEDGFAVTDGGYVAHYYSNTPAVIPAPVLSGPATGDTLAAQDTCLEWMPVPNVTSYEVQIASDSAFSYVVLDSIVVSDTAFTIENIIDSKLSLETKYFWRVKAIDSTNSSQFSATWSFITPSRITGIQTNANGIPKTYQLSQNYPNPFNPTTVIKYSLPKAQFVTLVVYDVLGQEVASLVNERQAAGNYQVNFSGDRFASGVYFYILKAGHFVSTRKMLLLK